MNNWIDKIDKRIRNVSLMILIIGFSLMIIWMIFDVYTPNKKLHFILIIGIALFLAGTLAFTRIQFVLWLQKRITRESN